MCAITSLFQHRKMQGNVCSHLSVSTQANARQCVLSSVSIQAKCRAMCAITSLFQHRQLQGNVCNHLSVSTQAKCRAMCAITSLFQHRQSAGQCVQSPLYFNTGKVQGNVCNHLSISTQAKYWGIHATPASVTGVSAMTTTPCVTTAAVDVSVIPPLDTCSLPTPSYVSLVSLPYILSYVFDMLSVMTLSRRILTLLVNLSIY